jgi:hypothetical protein
MPNYGDPMYWNKRYKEQAGTTYDWLLNYEHFRPQVKKVMQKHLNLLLVDLRVKKEKWTDQLIDDEENGSDQEFVPGAKRAEPLTELEEQMLQTGLDTNDFRLVTPEITVLNLGSGTSLLAEEMFERDGFTQIFNVDRSPVAVRQMKYKSAQKHLPPSILCKYKPMTRLKTSVRTSAS